MSTAEHYATVYGWAVFPLSPRSKIPYAGTRGLLEATRDPEQIRQWRSLINGGGRPNLAVATGHISGIVVIDIDPDHGGDDSWRALIDRHGGYPDTVESLTPRGGRHIYFQLPDGCVIRNNAGTKLGPGVDVRGDGGYVVAPPSVGANGRSYAWEASCSPEDGLAPAPLPGWLRDLIEDKPGQSRTAAPAIDGSIPQGQRDNHMTSLAGSMRRRGMAEASILAALQAENARCDPPLAEADIQRIARSVARYEPAQASNAITGGNGAIDPAGLGGEADPARDPEPPPAFTEIDLSGLMQAEIDPPRFAIDPWLPLRQVTLFGGHGGTGKSSIALVIAAHVACGRPFAGLAVRQMPVLFASLEDEPALLLYRLKRIVQAYNLPPEEVIANIRILDGASSASTLFAEEAFGQTRPTAAYYELAERCVGAGLVVIDNASDAFDANENHRRSVRSFVRSLVAIGRANDSAILLLAHIDKNAAKFGAQGNTYSGSTAWHNSARSRLALTDDDGAVTVTHEKINLGKPAEPVQFAFDGAVPMIRSAGAGPVEDLATAMIREGAIIAAIRAAESAGVCVPSRTVPGNSSAQAVLAPYPEYAAVFGGKAGATAAAKTITAMLRAGRLAVAAYQKPNRHSAEKLVVVGG